MAKMLRSRRRSDRPVPEEVFISAERIYAGTGKDVDQERVHDWAGEPGEDATQTARKVLTLAAR